MYVLMNLILLVMMTFPVRHASLNVSFEHAARIATLAESFSLTCFCDFQTKVIDSTLLGKDLIQGVENHFAFNFHPYTNRKRALLSHPQLKIR